MVLKYEYSVIPGERMDSALARDLSRLFSSSYGRWSRKSPVNPGGRIRLGARYYLENYARRDYRIATCRERGTLIAQAVYFQKRTERGEVSVVVQLVVDERHRRQGVATALLHAIWGFSDFYAWGIVTSSPCTVEALEAATFRRCRASDISRSAPFISKAVLADIPFLKDASWTSDGASSVVRTDFYTDRTSKSVARQRVESRLGKIAEGEEWLALTFRAQPLDLEDAYSKIIECSGRMVAEAYRRQPQSRQPWAAKAKAEVDSLLRWLPEIGRDTPICDFGAGEGRHIAEFRKRGYKAVSGIDFAVTPRGRKAGVVEADCRSWRSSDRFGLITCLYDVVGSFEDERSNLAILRNIARHLRAGGYAAVSVAHAGFSSLASVPRVDSSNRRGLLKAVFSLAPSRTMATSGEFFSAKAMLKDIREPVFYHKEQFDGEGVFPGEYLVVDRRYTAGAIEKLVQRAGLTVVQRRFVRAGFDERSRRSDGKEILVIARK